MKCDLTNCWQHSVSPKRYICCYYPAGKRKWCSPLLIQQQCRYRWTLILQCIATHLSLWWKRRVCLSVAAEWLSCKETSIVFPKQARRNSTSSWYHSMSQCWYNFQQIGSTESPYSHLAAFCSITHGFKYL